jgi:D-beta-D-heptose 7-phosphate kinase/D-beta-D-heptose 1-phosphate adenosyltransferase
MFNLDYKKPNILVIGDFLQDIYNYGIITRINPESPCPLINNKEVTYSLGGAGNVVNNLISLNANVFAIGIIGYDDAGRFIEKQLHSLLTMSNCFLFKIKNKTTPVKTRFYADNVQLLRVDKEHNCELSIENKNDICMNLKTILKNTKIDSVIVSDYNKGITDDGLCQEYIKICKDQNIPIYIDPKKDFKYYKNCTFIKPNLSEVEKFAHFNFYDYKTMLQYIIGTYQIETAMITLGNQGLVYLERGKEFKHFQSEIAEVKDVCGAGDTVLSTFVYLKSIGLDSYKAAELANIAGGISCLHIGTYSVKLNDLIQKTKIISDKILKNILPNNKKIVFCNGCFDPIHPGHIELFKYAKAQGDILIVATNCDAYIKRKGNNRPNFLLNDRLNMLASIQYIDYVTWFDEDTPENLLKIINPNIYVVGNDHANDHTKIIKDVRIFNRYGNYSSSKIN